MDKDLVVIGGGPGGYVAAIRAAQLGAKVTLVEDDKVGGTCLNRGCIPTKALYKNAQIMHTLNKSSHFGIELKEYSLNMQKVQERKQNVVSRLCSGVEQLLKGNRVEVISGRGSLVDRNTVAVTTPTGGKELIKAKNILIATGSLPAKIPIAGLDLPGVITSNEALELDHVPKSMVIIGGGVVGIEFAGIFNSFGTQVTVVEFLPRILPPVDEEIVKRAAMYLKKQGIKIETGIKVKEIKEENGELKVLAEGKKGEQEFFGEMVLVSAGRSINIDGLNLDEVGVAYDRRGIKVNSRFETSVPGIYAIGDVIGGQMLAHVASDEGKAAVENMLGLEGHINYDAVPSCVFSFPEIASVGLTEEAAKERGISYLTGKFMFVANGKALTMGETDGLVKVVAEEETKKVIGVHILGPHASDLIHEGVLAVEHGLTTGEMGRAIHAHPTLAESVMEAVAGIENKAIHIMPGGR
ncbi:MAG: dihydrolipoyl dehydrogenase [Bacillota bacterium]|jgi:dihydrolipoamide dehydrogenase